MIHSRAISQEVPPDHETDRKDVLLLVVDEINKRTLKYFLSHSVQEWIIVITNAFTFMVLYFVRQATTLTLTCQSPYSHVTAFILIGIKSFLYGAAFHTPIDVFFKGEGRDYTSVCRVCENVGPAYWVS